MYKSNRPVIKFSKLKGRCSSNKLRYKDRRMAVDALHHSQNIAALAIEMTGETKRKETRIYKCPECAGFHLSSKPFWIEVKVAA